MILVLAGTIEGRQIVMALQNDGWPVLASVTSQYGTALLERDGALRIRQGALDYEHLLGLLHQHPFQYIVDATHPFAEEISRNAIQAAAATGIEYLRLERTGEELPQGAWIQTIHKLEDLALYLRPGQRIFSTIGSKNLARLVAITTAAKSELIVRVLPSSQVLQACEDLGLRPDQIIAMKGPFSTAVNKALFRKYHVDMVISKDSGNAGGFEEKLQAAEECGIPMVVWTRPKLEYPRVFESVGDLAGYINQKKECS